MMAESDVVFYSFGESRETMENYLERFTLFRYIQYWQTDKKQQILLISLSPEVYTKLNDLVMPNDLTKIPFSQLTEWLLKIYTKQTKIATERLKLHRLLQQTGKPIDENLE